jgi:hypothetical protein
MSEKSQGNKGGTILRKEKEHQESQRKYRGAEKHGEEERQWNKLGNSLQL